MAKRWRQKDKRGSPFFCPHLFAGSLHFCLTIRITDDASLAARMKPERYRGVRCIRGAFRISSNLRKRCHVTHEQAGSTRSCCWRGTALMQTQAHAPQPSLCYPPVSISNQENVTLNRLHTRRLPGYRPLCQYPEKTTPLSLNRLGSLLMAPGPYIKRCKSTKRGAFRDVAQPSSLLYRRLPVGTGLWRKLWGVGSHFLGLLIKFQFRI